MTVSLTIRNADKALISALKSVCKLHPEAQISIKKHYSLAEELKAEHQEILDSYSKGTLQTFDSMEEYEAAHGL